MKGLLFFWCLFSLTFEISYLTLIWLLYLASLRTECYLTISAVDVISGSKEYITHQSYITFFPNQWKAFSKNSRPARVCYGLFTKMPKLNVIRNFFGKFIQTQERYVEILQLRAKFQTAIVLCLRFIWITNSSDHRRALWPNGLGNYFVCKTFAVHTLLWSLEFVVQINLEHDTITVQKRYPNYIGKMSVRTWRLLVMSSYFFYELNSLRTPCKTSHLSLWL